MSVQGGRRETDHKTSADVGALIGFCCSVCAVDFPASADGSVLVTHNGMCQACFDADRAWKQAVLAGATPGCG